LPNIIAILSCHSLRHYQQEQRSTWIKDIPTGTDYKFFLGNPKDTPSSDEIFLDVADDWSSITQKCVLMFSWVLEHGYTWAFKCDLDTLVRPRQLLGSGLDVYDWVGGRNSFFASGGAGYGLSRRAMENVLRHPITTTCEEDVHMARALLEQGIELHADPRFKFIPGQSLNPEDLTMHLSSVRAWDAKYQPWMMKEAWEAKGVYYPLGAPVQRPIRFRRLR
jgi:hypothetical protein